MAWNYLSVPKLQRLNRWSLGMDKWFHPTLHRACDYLSLLGLKLSHVSKRGHRTRGWSARRYTHGVVVFWFLVVTQLIPVGRFISNDFNQTIHGSFRSTPAIHPMYICDNKFNWRVVHTVKNKIYVGYKNAYRWLAVSYVWNSIS